MDASIGRKIRRIVLFGLLPSSLLLGIGGFFFHSLWLPFLPVACVTVMGLQDMLQKKQAILRNFPILGRGRYMMEEIRPELHQYFVESNTNGMPFDRLRRANIYQRAKNQLDTLPFGAQKNMYEPGYEWINHSIVPKAIMSEPPRVLVGGANTTQPYSCALLNISAMSYGSLSPNAIASLNGGAKIGGFAHNTGEGGISPYHQQEGGDLIYQIGTGYFGSRAADGGFCPEKFQVKSHLEQVKMIEVKLSQGAKPGHGGILPAKKLTPEIAEIRGVPMGFDVISPPYHKAFSTPVGLLEFITQLRTLSGGKPVGMKMCLGNPKEFISICKAMVETGMMPDYISIDGGEGGTGAAPLEFSNSIGHPLEDGLIFVHNALVGYGLRDKLTLFCAGKITSGFDMASRMALGADVCYSARGMMFALGCIQALRCNSNDCPTGVATQDPNLYQGVVVTDKKRRVANFQKAMVHSLMDIIAAAGLEHPNQVRPEHIFRRVDLTRVMTYQQLFHFLEPGELLSEDNLPDHYKQYCLAARPDQF